MKYANERDLFRSISENDSEGVRGLLRAGISPNCCSSPRADLSALGKAVALGRYECVVALLEAGADPSMRDGSGSTPLKHARTLQIARALVDAGADVNAKCHADLVPVDFFARTLRFPLLQLLLERGAQV